MKLVVSIVTSRHTCLTCTEATLQTRKTRDDSVHMKLRDAMNLCNFAPKSSPVNDVMNRASRGALQMAQR
jgi:hypothetical protein